MVALSDAKGNVVDIFVGLFAEIDRRIYHHLSEKPGFLAPSSIADNTVTIVDKRALAIGKRMKSKIKGKVHRLLKLIVVAGYKWTEPYDERITRKADSRALDSCIDYLIISIEGSIGNLRTHQSYRDK